MSSAYYNNGGEEGSTEQLAKRNKYIYAWLPSFTEIGGHYWNDDREIDYCGIWGLSPDHIGWNDDSDNTWAWLRSGREGLYNYARMFSFVGGWSAYPVTASYGLRPAMHINLSAIKRSLE